MDKRNINIIVAKADAIGGGSNPWAVKWFIWGCTLFCAIIHVGIICNINGDNMGSIINIIPPYYLMFLAGNIYGSKRLHSIIPLKHYEVNRMWFRQTEITSVIWLVVVSLHNVAYMFNSTLYDVRGVLGLCVVVTAVQHILGYVGKFVSSKKWISAVPAVVMIIFTVFYLVVMFLEMADKSMELLRGLSAVFGVFSGPVAIVVSIVVSVGIILHFYLFQAKKERAWEV